MLRIVWLRAVGQHLSGACTERTPYGPTPSTGQGRSPLSAATQFGDDEDRFARSRARKNYSGQSPITRATGKKSVVLARYATNRRLAGAGHLQTFAAIVARSSLTSAAAVASLVSAHGERHRWTNGLAAVYRVGPTSPWK